MAAVGKIINCQKLCTEVAGDKFRITSETEIDERREKSRRVSRDGMFAVPAIITG